MSRYGNGLNGEYVIGLSSGGIDGDLRDAYAGGDMVVIFGYDGVYEMDPSSGGGWLQVLENGTLEGEFMGALGPFTALRQGARRKQPRRTPAGPKRRRR